MALDATKGNRARETEILIAEYASIYNTNNENEIKKLLAFEITLIDYLNKKLKETDIVKLLEKTNDYLLLNNVQLSNTRKKGSDSLKEYFKPEFEVIHFYLADDLSIGIHLRVTKTKKTENYIVKLTTPDISETIEDFKGRLLAKETSIGVKDTKGIKKLKKELTLLQQLIK